MKWSPRQTTVFVLITCGGFWLTVFVVSILKF